MRLRAIAREGLRQGDGEGGERQLSPQDSYFQDKLQVRGEEEGGRR